MIGKSRRKRETGVIMVGYLLPSKAFNMIDQNRDGFIDNEDLKDMLASLGQSFLVTSTSLQP